MFIFREELYDTSSERKGIAEIIVAKHRNGPVGNINLRFFDKTARFSDLELYREPIGLTRMTTNDAPRTGLIDPEPSVLAPAALFSNLAAEVSEIEELQVLLAIFRMLDAHGGAEHPLAEDAIERDRWLRRALKLEGSPNAPTERIAQGACARRRPGHPAPVRHALGSRVARLVLCQYDRKPNPTPANGDRRRTAAGRVAAR